MITYRSHPWLLPLGLLDSFPLYAGFPSFTPKVVYTLQLLGHFQNKAINMANDVDKSTDNCSAPEGPTDSHFLSQIKPDEKGASQLGGDSTEIIDLGWTKPVEHIDERLIAGLSNEDLWMLIRRFDRVRFKTKT